MRLLPAVGGCALVVMSIAVAIPYRSLSGADAAITQDDHPAFNLANLNAGAQVVYVSSGPIAFARRMIDDDVQTTFRFRGSDPHPTAIIQLAATQPIVRVSTVLKTKAARLDLYLMNKLSDSHDLQGLKPIASIVNLPADGKVTVDLAAGGARYLALRWGVENPRQEFFEVAEISAFGTTPLALLDLISPSLADATTHLPGQTGPDFSNQLGTLADPPTIALVSP